MAGPEQVRALTLVHVHTLGQAMVAPALPSTLRSIAPLPAATANKRVIFSEGTGPVRQPQDLQFMVNGQRYDAARVDFESTVGETELWELVNGSAMDHPFHIHGTQFQIIERSFNGQTKPEPWLAWKDTVNLRHAERVTIKMRQDFPGLRMFHCHILEHESLGMMGNLMVRELA
jgi:suppressor of ftsI